MYSLACVKKKAIASADAPIMYNLHKKTGLLCYSML